MEKGIKLTYLETDLDNTGSYKKQLDKDSIVYKVEIKPDSPFEPFRLDSYLQRTFGDFLCVEVKPTATAFRMGLRDKD